MTKMKYNIGDLVLLRNDLKEGERYSVDYYNLYCSKQVSELKGKIVRIIKIDKEINTYEITLNNIPIGRVNDSMIFCLKEKWIWPDINNDYVEMKEDYLINKKVLTSYRTKIVTTIFDETENPVDKKYLMEVYDYLLGINSNIDKMIECLSRYIKNKIEKDNDSINLNFCLKLYKNMHNLNIDKLIIEGKKLDELNIIKKFIIECNNKALLLRLCKIYNMISLDNFNDEMIINRYKEAIKKLSLRNQGPGTLHDWISSHDF